MLKPLVLLALILCATFTASAFADQPIYKWTDSNGTLHYSDKPPARATSDLQTMDLPAFPPQDPAKIAADQAALAAGTAALLKQLQAEDTLRQQEMALAERQAQLQAAIDAADEQDNELEVVPVNAIYVNSPFLPRAYRRNLYGPHLHRPRFHVSKGQPVMRLTATPITRP